MGVMVIMHLTNFFIVIKYVYTYINTFIHMTGGRVSEGRGDYEFEGSKSGDQAFCRDLSG